MKKTLYTLLLLCAISTLASCSFGNAINDFNDECPITLTTGITAVSAESSQKGKQLEIKISVNTSIWDVPESYDPLEWSSLKSTLLSMLRENEHGKKLLKEAKDKTVNVIVTNQNGTIISPIRMPNF